MSIFKKAGDLNQLPNFINEAYFEDNKISVNDEFSGLLKEASSNKAIYERRKNEFQKSLKQPSHEFQAPQPAKYAEAEGGIRRASYGTRFLDENSQLFGTERARNISYDNPYFEESQARNGLSIWDSEFDILQEGFNQSQQQNNAVTHRFSLAEKRKLQSAEWENNQLNSIRQTKVLPYRGLGITRASNETSYSNERFGSVNEYYAEVQDALRNEVRSFNKERKNIIERKGFDPEEARSQWENKEAIAARTMESLKNASFLAQFADRISGDDE